MTPDFNKKLLEYNEVAKDYKAETDRAAAVLASGYLEAKLEELLRKRLRPGKVTDELLGGTSPLGSMSAKASMLYSMAEINDTVFRDLTLIRKIRNRFAHDYTQLSFQDPEIKSRCNELSISQELKKSKHSNHSPRDQFLLGVATVFLALADRLHPSGG